MTDQLESTLIEVARFLTDQDVRFAVIGGLAASVWGEPRVTADVDLVVATDVTGGLELLNACKSSPFSPLFSEADEVVERAFILPLRHEQTGVKVDIAIGMSGFEQRVVDRAKPLSFGDQQIPFASAEDILIMKTFAGRPRDWEDAIGIVNARREELDWNYCLDMAEKLGSAVDQDLVSQLRKLQTGEA